MEFEDIYRAYQDGTMPPAAIAMADQQVAAIKDRTRELMGLYIQTAFSRHDIAEMSEHTREIQTKIRETLADPIIGPGVILNMVGMLVSVGMTMMLDELVNGDGEDA